MNQNHDDADPRLGLGAPGDPGRTPQDGPDHVTERQAELLGAAAADDLSPAERQELETMCAQDPRLAQELRELRQTSAALGQHLRGWGEETPSPELKTRVLAEVHAGTDPARSSTASSSAPSSTPAPTAQTQAAPLHSAGPLPARRRSDTPRARRRTVTLAAVCVALGVGATLGIQAVLDSGPADTGSDPASGFLAEQPSGAPGDLGVLEPVSFTDPDLSGEDAEVTVDGALVAHSWGTETVLEITGLPVGSSYSVVLVGEDGEEIESGSFLGSELPVECRMNGAVLRENVDRLEIRTDDGTALTAAELPDVD